MKLENEHLIKYFSHGYRAVEGWLQVEVFWILDRLSHYQKQQGIRGGFAEIGVHQGKFLIALESVTEPGELGLAVDIFDDQHLNIDRSGKGNLEILQDNLKKYCRDYGRLRIQKLDSTTVEAHRLFQGLDRPISLFSVDGGHTKQHLINDLRLTEACLVNGGFVFVDDYCNPGFPGVTEGLLAYLSHGSRLVPVCAAGGKIVLTTLSYGSAARSAFASALKAEPSFRIRPTEIAGLPYLYFRRDTNA